jgi:cytochrome c5
MKGILILVISLISFNVQATECSTAFGEQVYPAFCGSCHDALPREMVPKFELGDRLDKTDDELIDTILNGKGMMPPWNVQNWTEEQLNEIICYLRSLQES